MSAAVEEAKERFETEIAEPLGESVEDAALSVLKVANAKMTREIRRVTIERGRDPANFSLVAFGGAGPLQAAAVGRQMDMESIVLPQSPGVFSARGLLLADVRMDESEAYRGQSPDADRARSQFRALEETLDDRFVEQGFDADDVAIEKSLDLRYEGQSYELAVPLTGDTLTEDVLEATLERFHDKHAQLYGYAMAEEPVEAITLRASGQIETPPLASQRGESSAEAVRTERDVYFEDGGFTATPIYVRSGLTTGQQITGPAIIEEPGCTSLVPPGTTGEVSQSGNILLDL
jgi:N-methylhydantoinase A